MARCQGAGGITTKHIPLLSLSSCEIAPTALPAVSLGVRACAMGALALPQGAAFT